METIKKHAVVILAFALPLLLLAGVLVMAYMPRAHVSTEYDFIYATCDNASELYPYDCGLYLNSLYVVEDGKLKVRNVDVNEQILNEKRPFPVSDMPLDGEQLYVARIFFHDTDKNESHEIAIEEAQALTLYGLLTSPDGVTVDNVYDTGPSFFPFFDNNSRYGYYLTKGSRRSPLNIVNKDDRYYYQNNIKFIGWITP
ncbi:MAG: hypothetical protein COU90_04250 [Candidatus Ryanbacteria bacterium CG10_big_fil_rev_8_21_14_0_10_43_42]|uniref:Uncharacterized protein n=1 Tax=Candidatus Ryanbacteria bacterium CG10_big_fil_rev_8_21_14_0_10_43_42 TaxID=1974864 RepID=A0A2M8KVU6_9BACT|nr:MAG: hypothetical protein COU90_04250 [Candidatus Ryanbacteria bacterium CG10_big_fil_rev_8_21_14_0_10_43_42]